MAPKRSLPKAAPKRLSTTPNKQVVKVKKEDVKVKKESQASSSQSCSKPQRKIATPITSLERQSAGLQKTAATTTPFLQDFVKMDRSVNFSGSSTQPHADGTAKCLQEQAAQVDRELLHHQLVVAASKARVEEAKAELVAAAKSHQVAQERAEKLAADLKLAKLKYEVVEQREMRRDAVMKRAPSQATNFEYQTKGGLTENGASTQHSLHVSFRQLDKARGSKDWRVDPEELKALEVHHFPSDAEAEIGPATGASHAESLLSPTAILEKIDLLQEEACAYIESSISFKPDAGSRPEMLLARRQQFRAYIELEIGSCIGPFTRIRAWLQERQRLEQNVSALFVRRNETRQTQPAHSDLPYSFVLNGSGCLYLCGDDCCGEMVSLQVKRDYSSHVSK